ncbi:hypothetical protein PsorP6_002573 [Peronosclerospora sorghi]|uniref:Uncharacterized protein n=1 Tax=Peronosclerospora sorghi TaxID=230839 RepID=A0ACC0WRN5_9STRA|nr:hypothetical protein PsorP6_002573 [Peronosclerospora sorghi]
MRDPTLFVDWGPSLEGLDLSGDEALIQNSNMQDLYRRQKVATVVQQTSQSHHQLLEPSSSAFSKGAAGADHVTTTPINKQDPPRRCENDGDTVVTGETGASSHVSPNQTGRSKSFQVRHSAADIASKRATTSKSKATKKAVQLTGKCTQTQQPISHPPNVNQKPTP